MVVVKQINSGKPRKIYVLGDQHIGDRRIGYPLNEQQFHQIEKILAERSRGGNKTPLHALVEQPTPFMLMNSDLLLARLSQLSMQKHGTCCIENIEIRAAALAAIRLLGRKEPNLPDRYALNPELLDFTDQDSCHTLLNLTFTDLFKAFETRKQQINIKLKQFGIEDALLQSYVRSAELSIERVRNCRSELQETVDEDSILKWSNSLIQSNKGDKLLKHKSGKLLEHIGLAFGPLFDLYTVCRTQEISHDSDILIQIGECILNDRFDSSNFYFRRLNYIDQTDYEFIQNIIDTGININTTHKYVYDIYMNKPAIEYVSTVLELYIMFCTDIRIIKLLLINGADYSANNFRALELAIEYNNLELVKILLDMGSFLDENFELEVEPNIINLIESYGMPTHNLIKKLII